MSQRHNRNIAIHSLRDKAASSTGFWQGREAHLLSCCKQYRMTQRNNGLGVVSVTVIVSFMGI